LPGRHGLPQKLPIRRAGGATMAISPAARAVCTAWRRLSGWRTTWTM
jgi:hypothetical protein